LSRPTPAQRTADQDSCYEDSRQTPAKRTADQDCRKQRGRPVGLAKVLTDAEA